MPKYKNISKSHDLNEKIFPFSVKMKKKIILIRFIEIPQISFNFH